MTPALCARSPLARWFTVGLLAAIAPARAQSTRPTAAIDGVVTDTLLAPLADATVSLLGSTVRVVTKTNGRFRIVDLPPGEYVLFVRRIGYAASSSTIELTAGDTLRPSFTLRGAVAELDTVVVADKGGLWPIERDFEDRRRKGFGHFLTQDQIERLNFVDLTDVLMTVPGVSPIMTNTRDPFLKCPYQFFLDGTPLNNHKLVETLPRPSEVFGVEVYSGPAEIPLQFKTKGPNANPHSGSFCGVILVWTKRGKA